MYRFDALKPHADAVKILLADDDPDRARYLQRALAKDTGIQALIAPADEPLADAVARLRPDVVLVDMSRPDRDALEGVRLLNRSQPHPVVLFVDQDDPAFMEEAIGAGVLSYNVGTVSPNEVRPLLRAAVLLFQQHQATRSALTAAEARLKDIATQDRAKAILMRERKMTEPEAHRWMQQRAMASGRKIKDIAEDIVAAGGKTKP